MLGLILSLADLGLISSLADLGLILSLADFGAGFVPRTSLVITQSSRITNVKRSVSSVFNIFISLCVGVALFLCVWAWTGILGYLLRSPI